MKAQREIIGGLGNVMFKEAYILSQMWKEEIPDQYLQSEKYWSEFKEQIKAHFGQDIPRKKDMIALHIRRGDYVNNPFYVDLWNTDYYEKALAEFPNERFLIFSDDILWCEDRFIGDEYQFNYGAEVEAMNVMASCKGIITANSSFSWWAGYISPHAEKIIAPKQWFTDGITRTDIPENWVQL